MDVCCVCVHLLDNVTYQINNSYILQLFFLGLISKFTNT